MKTYELLIIIFLVVFVLGAIWYKYQQNINYANELEKQREAQMVTRTNIQGDVIQDSMGPNLLDKELTEVEPDELVFPEHAGKGVRQLEPEQHMIDKYYTNQNQDVPINNKRLPIGECPISRPMSRDLPVANAPMCMAVRDDSDMRLH